MSEKACPKCGKPYVQAWVADCLCGGKDADDAFLTRCEICKQDCKTMAGLIVHVRKWHS